MASDENKTSTTSATKPNEESPSLLGFLGKSLDAISNATTGEASKTDAKDAAAPKNGEKAEDKKDDKKADSTKDDKDAKKADSEDKKEDKDAKKPQFGMPFSSKQKLDKSPCLPCCAEEYDEVTDSFDAMNLKPGESPLYTVCPFSFFFLLFSLQNFSVVSMFVSVPISRIIIDLS